MSKVKTLQEILRPSPRKREIFYFKDFINIVRDTYNMINGDKWGSFVHAFPIQDNKQPLNPPIITYQVIEKTPSQLGSCRQIKPGIRTSGLDYDSQQMSTTYTQRFLYLVEFGIWESSWDKAIEHGEKFEDFMLTYTGLFKELGVTEILYGSATEDVARASWRADLMAYHVVYQVYIERHITVLNKIIESIKVHFLGGEIKNGEL